MTPQLQIYHDDGDTAPDIRELPAVTVSLVLSRHDTRVTEFIESLLLQDYPIDRIEVRICYVSYETDLWTRLLRMKQQVGYRFGEFELLHLPGVAFSAAHNRNVQQDSGSYVMMCAADVHLETNAFRTAVRQAQQTTERIAAWEFEPISAANSGGRVPAVPDPTKLGHCALVDRRAYLDVGGLNEHDTLESAAVELWYRFRESGYRLAACAAARYRLAPPPAAETDDVEEPYERTLFRAFMRLRYGRRLRRFALLRDLWTLCRRPVGDWRGKLAPGEVVGRILRRAPGFILASRRSSRTFPVCGWADDFLQSRPGHRLDAQLDRSWPLVSIVVRTEQGRQGFLRECLQALVFQSHAKLEIIVSEAGCTGFANDVLRLPAIAALPSLHYVQTANTRPSRVANAGLDAASGDFLIVIDDDNLLLPDHIATLLAVLDSDPSAPGAYAATFEVDTEIVSSDPLVYREGRRRKRANRPFSKARLWKKDYIPLTGLMVRRSACERAGGFDPTLAAAEAWDFALKIARLGPLLYSPRITAVCRAPAGGAARRRRDEMLRANRKAIEEKWAEAAPA